jgi:Fe-S-cluster containining protein
MIAIENVLISDEVIEAKFVCDLDKCKGGCCEDGDAGAPLEKEERKILDKYFDVIKPYLTKEGLAEIQSQGRYLYDREFGWVTPTVGGKICAYGFRDDKGIIKCGIEQAYNDSKLPWKKPISCHLYPIKISKRKEYTNLNYEPRDVLCNPACALGKKLKVPVYQFLKEAIVRKFGEEFYAALHQVAVEHFQEEKSRK